MAAPIIYVSGDKTKTPVDPKEQPPGTLLVVVGPNGRDVTFRAGVYKANDEEKRIARWNKARKNNESES